MPTKAAPLSMALPSHADQRLLQNASKLADQALQQFRRVRQIVTFPGADRNWRDGDHQAMIASIAQCIDQDALAALNHANVTPRTIRVIELCMATAQECRDGSREATDVGRAMLQGNGKILASFGRDELTTLELTLEATENYFERAIGALERLDGSGAETIQTALKSDACDKLTQLRAAFDRRSRSSRPVPALLHLVRISACIESYHHATNSICAHIRRCCSA